MSFMWFFTIIMLFDGIARTVVTQEIKENVNIAGLYLKDEKILNSKFLFYVLMNDFDENFGDRKRKFIMANMSLIRNLEIVLPSIAEPKKLISIIEGKEK